MTNKLPFTPPRYDDVFSEGMETLNSESELTGDIAQIGQREKHEKTAEFYAVLEALLIAAPLPWRVMGYIMAAAADNVAADYDMDYCRSWEYFKAGFQSWLDGEALQ